MKRISLVIELDGQEAEKALRFLLGEPEQPTCTPKFLWKPGADVDDISNWTCEVTGGAKCADGKECKARFKMGKKDDGTEYRFVSCCD